jgi:hypothetical protein
MDVSVIGPISSLYTLVPAVLGVLILKEQMSTRKLLGMSHFAHGRSRYSFTPRSSHLYVLSSLSLSVLSLTLPPSILCCLLTSTLGILLAIFAMYLLSTSEGSHKEIPPVRKTEDV